MRNSQQKLSPPPVEVDDTMNEPASKSRFAIDLEDLEKQLKMPSTPARGGDALAELARIVGRDDPLKGLFAHRQTPATAATAPSLRPAQGVDQRIEPSFEQPGEDAGHPNLRGALDEFDALLRRDLGSRAEQSARQDLSRQDLSRQDLSHQDVSRHEPVAHTPVEDIPADDTRAYDRPAYDPPAYDLPAYDLAAYDPAAYGQRLGPLPSAQDETPDSSFTLRPRIDPASEPAEIAVSAEPPVYSAATRAEPVMMDRFIAELEQGGRIGVDTPPHRASEGLVDGQGAMMDERRAPHDLDEPRDLGRPGRAAADPRFSRDLDEQLVSYPPPPTGHVEDLRSLAPRRSRKGVVTIGVLLGLGGLGIVGAMTYRTLPKAAVGEPPVIKAETGPNKIAPQSPGGTEVPNQNKQIYDRAGETRAADTKVVSREEQPVDVQQAARAAARVILPVPAGAATTGSDASASPLPATASVSAAAPSAATPSGATPSGSVPTAAAPVSGLGEPRRVRTVSIRPDGSVVPPAGTASPPVASASPSALPPGRTSPVPTLVLPQAAAGPQPPVRPVIAAPRPTTPRVAAPEDGATDAAAPVRTNSNALARPKVQDRITDRVASAPAPAAGVAAGAATASAVASEAPVPGGGFAVQLGAPGSEAEARSTFAALQRKYPGELGGQSPLIRKADVNGREVYRLRVGPLSRDGATSLCTRLKSAGGNCFVAQN
jgi:hypothetical protein